MELPESDSEDELPPGWEERCTSDGLVFYAHHGTKSTQWTHPRTGKKKKVVGELPYGWERQITEDGKVFFVDHISHKTTYADPRLAFAIEETSSASELRQRFDGSSTGLQVLHGKDLSSLVAVVTGSNCGIVCSKLLTVCILSYKSSIEPNELKLWKNFKSQPSEGHKIIVYGGFPKSISFETARSLAYHGCIVIFACRNVQKAEKAIEQILEKRPNAKCKALYLDLASLRTVYLFCKEYANIYQYCHILVLNAGTFGASHSLTEDGYERTFQVNYLSHFYLACLMQPIMSNSGKARIVFVSSESHRFASLTLQNISEELLSPSSKHFRSIDVYNNSKLCCILAAAEMQYRFGMTGVNCFVVHPGNVVSSYLSRNWWLYRLLFFLVRPFTKSLQQACTSSVFCAVSEDVANCGGLYINNCIPCLPSSAALDGTLSNKLWILSINLIEKIIGKQAFYLNLK